MKRIFKNLYIGIFLVAAASCSDENSTEEDNIKLEGIVVELGERSTDNSKTRSVNDFAVNTSADPTRDVTRLTGGYSWKLRVNILDRNNADYPPGNSTCTFAGGFWMPDSALFFPSYKSPRVLATLYPPGWTDSTQIALDQSTNSNLLNQDILVQNGSPYTVRPSHTPNLVLRHGYTMLNFILSDVNSSQITSVDVVAGEQTYQPYLVPGRPAPEYMVILPTGTVNPVVRITTQAGARYQETVRTPGSGMAINTCYCVKLVGVELILSSVTIIDWIYGTALAGTYTTITSYPTFRGPENTTITLHFDNGLSQDITFNENGETTVRPFGRVIIQINDNPPLATPVILNEMYVDLRDYI